MALKRTAYNIYRFKDGAKVSTKVAAKANTAFNSYYGGNTKLIKIGENSYCAGSGYYFITSEKITSKEIKILYDAYKDPYPKLTETRFVYVYDRSSRLIGMVLSAEIASELMDIPLKFIKEQLLEQSVKPSMFNKHNIVFSYTKF